jgi:multiple sugar transport system substrate-binding protein
MVESLTAPARTVLLKSMIADFEKANPNIHVNLISPPTESADQKIQQMLQSKSGIDVMEVRDFTAGSFSANGWLYDMTNDLQNWPARSDLTDAAQQGGKVNGHSYFIPYGFYLASLFYRTDLVSKAGYTVPHSWDDVLKQAEALNNPKKNAYGYAFRGALHSDHDLSQLIETYVGDKLDPSNAFKLKDGSGTIFTTPEAKQAVDLYAQLFKKASPPSAIAWGYPEQVQGFNSGTTAFLMQSQEIIAALNKSTAFSPSQYATAPLPVGPNGTATQVLGSAGWGVAKSSKHTADSMKLVEFLTSGAESIKFAEGNYMVPNVKSAANDPFFKTSQWAAFATMDNQPSVYKLVTEPDEVSWWTAWQAKADNDVQNLLLGKMSADALLTSWDKYWTDKWKNAG